MATIGCGGKALSHEKEARRGETVRSTILVEGHQVKKTIAHRQGGGFVAVSGSLAGGVWQGGGVLVGPAVGFFSLGGSPGKDCRFRKDALLIIETLRER